MTDHPPSNIPITSEEVYKTEISTTGMAEHDNHVSGEIFRYTTQISDQNMLTDQRDTLYAYKSTIDPDTLYLHEAMKTIDWPQFRLAMQKEIDDRMKDNFFLSFINKSSQGQPQ